MLLKSFPQIRGISNVESVITYGAKYIYVITLVGCHSWRVSEAFTRWSSNLGLFFVGVLTTVPCMTPILPSSILNSSRIRPKKWAFLLKDPFLDRILVRRTRSA